MQPFILRAHWPLVTIAQREAIISHLNLTSPVRAAVVCATGVVFFAIARLGEIMQKGQAHIRQAPQARKRTQKLGAQDVCE
jgi:hypothetical protein